MLSKNKNLHHRQDSTKERDPQNLRLSESQVLHLLVALMGIFMLVTKPVLILFVFLLVGYGRYWHVETQKIPHRPWSRESHSEHSLHLGPSHDQRHGNLHDLAKGLIVNGEKGVHLLH